MRKFVILLIVLCLLSLGCTKKLSPLNGSISNIQSPSVIPLNSTSFKTFGARGTDQAWAVTTDDNSNVYFGSYEAVPGPFTDIYVRKLDPLWNEVWKTRIGGSFNDQLYGLKIADSILYGAGSTYKSMLDPKSADALLFALSENGNVLWNKTFDRGFGYEEIDGLEIRSDGIYVSGWSEGKNSSIDLFLAKYDKNGNLLWNATFGTSKHDEQNGEMIVDNDRIYVAGLLSGEAYALGGYWTLFAFDKNGNYFWNKTSFTYGADALGLTADDHFLYAVGIVPNLKDGGQIGLVKYDKSGQEIWSRTWGGNKGEASRTVLLKDGFVYVVGQSESFGQNGDIVILKFDTDGNLLNTSFWGKDHKEIAHGAIITSDSILIAGGTWSDGAGAEDALLLRLPN
ncbi:PQQ-like beta-propeller repeat protein [Candidatus Micrarchaeota archaeon]|nr:PQQ-like beta-propeller repeat protein [Candidatus Micrarchaeota archaeon]